MLGGRFTAIGLLVAVLVFLTGVIALLAAVVPNRRIRRRLSTILGTMGMTFSLLSLVGAFGGPVAQIFLPPEALEAFVPMQRITSAGAGVRTPLIQPGRGAP